MIIKTAEPFFFPGNKTGCLLVHGFTGAPKELRWMGEYLAEEGFSVLGVRLAGHATNPEEMIRTRYIDWMHSVEDGVYFLRGAADRIFLIGLSMGGALSLLMSTKLEVDGVIAMSTPYKIDLPSLKLAKILAPIVPYMSKSSDEPGATWFDQDAWKDHISYPQNPVRSAVEISLLLEEMRDSLPDATAPTLLVHSHNDTYIPSDSMKNIYNALGTDDKEMMWVTESGHVIPREPAKAQVFKAASAFIHRIDKAAK
ncbi:MAG: alpha/beta fold hydrolase [Anaerolineales bacterium]|uniref:Alpha/beta fold hydrolase n=1 Tax=Candidatus Desulfolinea nitratireducens TaxID=2841698 RepID=A0A8J6NG56_9CHLR|nr:alpha/beta fold hydrolase [Candidatus Desulfolinea nitratireducens]MBL6962005.1 alpha/beta fold hydrolase [Anaerolineales bacterium]